MKISLQNKLTSSVTILAALFVGFIGYLGYENAYEAHSEKIFDSEVTDLNNIVISINEKLSIVQQEANFVANFYAIQQLLNWQSVGVKSKIERWDKATKDTFKSLINLKGMYYKIRILDLKGQEKINVFFDQDSREAFVKSEEKLQDRAKKGYFSNSLNLEMGEVYTSEMALNMEFGKIVYPYVPVVHFSSVIYDKNGDRRGMAIINAYAEKIIESISLKKDKKRILIDQRGYYLYHDEDAKRWGWQLKSQENYAQDRPNVFEEVSKNEDGFYELDEKLYTYKRIYPDLKNKKEYWTLISEVDKSLAFEALYSFQQLFLIAIILTVLSLIIILRRYINSFLHPLKLVTEQIKALSRGELIYSNIDYKGDDEITDLIYSSKRLMGSIESTIEQAKAVASGDYSKRISIESSKDELGNAINEMTDRLDEVGKLAMNISQGELHGHIEIKSDKDALGVALSALVEYFQGITTVAESIAHGKFDVSFSSKGEQDRLGQAVNEMIFTLSNVVEQANAIANGDFEQRITASSQNDQLASALTQMTNKLKLNQLQNEENSWLQDGIRGLNEELSGNRNVHDVFQTSLGMLASYTNSASAAMFDYSSDSEVLKLMATYAFVERDNFKNTYHKGEGIIGQVATEGTTIHLHRSNTDSMLIDSSLMKERALSTLAIPIKFEGKLLGVMVFAFAQEVSALSISFLEEISGVLGSYIFTASKNEQIKNLLEESQQSFEELQVKSEELQQSNVQMEEQRQQLEQQAAELKVQNERVEKSRSDLDLQTQELERASKYKSEFLANMSHELRTPLNAIILLSKLLKENKTKKLEKDDVKKAEVIHRSGNDLLLLINDILDLSKIESGHMELSVSKLSTSEIRQNLFNLFGEMAKEKGLEFIVNDSIKGSINTDEQKLMQILKNLLSNAFKFTKNGSISLGIEPSSKEGYAYELSVSDTGIGIPKNKQELIFSAFKQVDGTISREYGGTGLGLSISKRFAELLDGEIEIHSEEGKGSTFTLYLSAQDEVEVDENFSNYEQENKNTTQYSSSDMITTLEDTLDTQEQSVTDEEFDLSEYKILIVDDDPRNIFTVSSALQANGAQTTHALSGKDGIEKIKDEIEDLDLVLMDIMMPEMDGYETIGRIRQDKSISKIPIIAVTAKAMKEERQKCLDAGADDYLSKPIDQRMLLRLCSSWIEKGSKR